MHRSVIVSVIVTSGFIYKKKNDEDFPLGWKGYGVELYAFCDAIRVIISPDIFLAFNYSINL